MLIGDTVRFTDLDITHLDLLLLESISCLCFAVIECAIALFTTVLHLLAHAIIFAFLLAEFAILTVALLF